MGDSPDKMSGMYDRVLSGDGGRPLYESHYLKANGPRGAFWLKYGLLTPRSPAQKPRAELWAMFWTDRGRQPTVVKSVRPFSTLRFGRDALRFEGERLLLEPTHAAGTIVQDGHSITWDLTLSDHAPALWHLPFSWMYNAPFPKKKVLTPSPRVVFSGTITVDGEVFTIEDWTGLRGHNWGSEHAWSYAYGNCNLWEDPSVSGLVDAFTAKIMLGPVRSPWLSLCVGELAATPLRWNALSDWIAKDADVTFPRWTLHFARDDASLDLVWEADPADVVGLRYLHPSGRCSYCYNTKYASLTVTLSPGGSARTQTFRSRMAELEFLFPTPVREIPLHGEGAL